MDLLRRVFANVVNTIVPDSFKEPNRSRKRSAGSYEPELTDDEEAADALFAISKRMRPNSDPDGPSTSGMSRALFEKPFETSSSRERIIPIVLNGNDERNGRTVGSSSVGGLFPITGSSSVSTSRQSVFRFSTSPFRKKPSWVTLKKHEKERKVPISAFEQFRKNHNTYHRPDLANTNADVVRLEERNEYMKMLNSFCSITPCFRNVFQSTSSKPSTSDDSGRSSQNGLKAYVKAKVPLAELVNAQINWFNNTNTTLPESFAMRELKHFHKEDSATSGENDTSKVIDTIDLSRDTDSEDSVICETRVSTPKPTFTPSFMLKKSVSTRKIESLKDRIEDVLNRSLGDIDTPIVINDDDDKESTVNSSEKENDDEVQVVSPPSLKRPPINSFVLEMNGSPFVSENWLKSQKSSFAEARRERAERIKREETALHILRNESTLDRDLSQIVRRNLTLTDIIVLEEPEVELELPEITDDMRDVINRARGRGSEVITTTINNIEITKPDIRSLAPMQWLNDNVINSYLDLVAKRSKSHNKWPSVYVFTTFFYPKFLNEGYSNILKRWTRKVDLFSFDLLIFPIHLGIHWCLAAADLRAKTIKYYDSLGGKNYQCPKALLQYLSKEHQERKKSSLGEYDWDTEIVEGIPQQQNGSDCGMFACKFAEYLSRDAELNFKQDDMNYYRERMIYEIISGDLLYP